MKLLPNERIELENAVATLNRIRRRLLAENSGFSRGAVSMIERAHGAIKNLLTWISP